MRVCVIGTSHIASLKLAERSTAAPSIEYTFFGVPAGKFSKIYCEDGIIKGDESIHDSLLKTSGGKYTQINPAEFDAVVFHGIDIKPDAAIYSIARSNQGTKVLFSRAFMKAGLKVWFEQTRAFGMARDIVGKSGAKVILSPIPCPADEPTDEEQVAIPLLSRLRPIVLDILDEICGESNIGFLRQPDETYGEQYYTKREYTQGSVSLARPDREHDEDDYTHMNGAYGLLVLGRLAKNLGGESGEHARRPRSIEG